ncbi:hypothetical protein PGT21_010367 [Puccinia graminis f. sp. tritici]|uniref:Uncharacterized protein n=1 Tax=Puccinia graminis f. sp. tritici TaxID=56615 RepID=A0A5B0M219_PUCGR|nr:hypothetical protein PGT21_010367 [Puccinia graminis f. sp. tritici]
MPARRWAFRAVPPKTRDPRSLQAPEGPRSFSFEGVPELLPGKPAHTSPRIASSHRSRMEYRARDREARDWCPVTCSVPIYQPLSIPYGSTSGILEGST